VPSPNIWDSPDVYEIENRAVDPDGVIDAALAELMSDGHSLGSDSWGTVLDIGCGTGFHLPRLAAAANQVIGVEPHPGLARRAARRVAGLANVTVRQGTAQALPVPDASIDLAHARWAYFFGPGCEPGLRELARVARRGCVTVVLDHDATRSSVGRWFAEGLRVDGIAYDPEVVERFWARNGFTRRKLDVHWEFASRADLAAVLAIEFPAAIAAAALAEVGAETPGPRIDAAVNLWFRRS
jgi:SAM-dependent methyltransferase